MMRIRLAIGALALLVAAAPQGAAQQRNHALVADEPGRFMIPLCQLRISGKVNDAQRQVKTGIEDKDRDKRLEALGRAEQILVQAIGTSDPENPAAWYYLGRAYLAQGDVAGADTAFTRAVALAPDCELDVNQYRQNAWAELANTGIQLQEEGRADSALALFRDANRIFRELPHVFENVAVMFANMGRNDSAAVYFEQALAVSEADTSLVENRNSAALNLVLVLQRDGRHQEAIEVLRRFLAWNPGDQEARRSVAYSFRELGMADSAEVVERALVEEFAAMELDSLSTMDLMAVGVSFFNSDEFARAAETFERVVRRNPWHRDAVYNLANVYLALKDNEKLVATGRRLLAIEPMSEDSYRLIGSGFRGLDRQDSLISAAEKLVTLPVHIEITQFTPRSSGARLTGTATGREATDVAGQPLPPRPVSLVVEFLTEDGRVVATSEVEVPALPPGTTHELRVEAAGAEIAAWRYRRK